MKLKMDTLIQKARAWMKWSRELPPPWSVYTTITRTPFKYFDETSWLVDFLLRTNATLEEICEELDAVVCPFPLEKKFKRPGDFWLRDQRGGGTYYHVMRGGTCLRFNEAHLPLYIYDYHHFSEKELATIREFIKVFGYKELPLKLAKRYEWYQHSMNIHRIRRDAKLTRLQVMKELEEECS